MNNRPLNLNENLLLSPNYTDLHKILKTEKDKVSSDNMSNIDNIEINKRSHDDSSSKFVIKKKETHVTKIIKKARKERADGPMKSINYF